LSVAVNTNGAGDVWHGALAAAILEGRQPREAVKFANAAASIKYSRLGCRAAIPTRDGCNSRTKLPADYQPSRGISRIWAQSLSGAARGS
jgi:bifunctional ADP-heptose synthase (sugar kinase/adenylyltransferase)